MSTWVKELADAGLVEQGSSQQDPIRITHTEQVGRLLTMASAVTLAAATEAQQAAEAQHADVRRATTKVHDDQTEANTDQAVEG